MQEYKYIKRGNGIGTTILFQIFSWGIRNVVFEGKKMFQHKSKLGSLIGERENRNLVVS